MAHLQLGRQNVTEHTLAADLVRGGTFLVIMYMKGVGDGVVLRLQLQLMLVLLLLRLAGVPEREVIGNPLVLLGEVARGCRTTN